MTQIPNSKFDGLAKNLKSVQTVIPACHPGENRHGIQSFQWLWTPVRQTCYLVIGIWELFVIWCLDFVILLGQMPFRDGRGVKCLIQYW